MHDTVIAWWDHARDLPWRSTDRQPWGVLVSEVMLQQTPVTRVEPVWRAWLTRWPEPADLAPRIRAKPSVAGDGSDTPGVLSGCTRRRTRRRTARRSGADLVSRAPGPPGGRGLRRQQRRCSRSGTVMRCSTPTFGVSSRAVGGTARPSPTTTAAERRRAESLMPADAATAVTWAVAVMELGALVCTARSPRCDACPLATTCAWQGAGAPAAMSPAPWTTLGGHRPAGERAADGRHAR